MADLLLIPDFGQTAEIDPEQERLRLAVEHADSSDRERAAAALEQYERAPVDGKPQLRVRFVPVPIYSRAMSMLARAKDDIEAAYDAYREIARWGVVGWNLRGPFGKESVVHRGQTWELAAWSAVDVLEYRGWLIPAARAIIRCNELSEEQKKK